MSAHLFILNLKLSRFALTAWALFLGVYGLLVVYLYPSIDNSASFVEHLGRLPLEVRSAMGLTAATIEEVFPDGRFTFYGALTTNYLIWVPVFVGIYAVYFGSGAVGRERSLGILGTLFSLPLRRHEFILAKSTAFIVILALLGLVSFGAVAAAVAIVDINTNIGNVALAHAIGFLLVLAIFSYSVLVSSLLMKPQSALAVAVLVTFASYMLNFMSPSYGSASWLAKGSIFHFYQPLALLNSADVNWAGVGVYGGIVVFAHLASIGVLLRRDVKA